MCLIYNLQYDIVYWYTIYNIHTIILSWHSLRLLFVSIFTAADSVGGTSMGCRAEIRTRACLTASQRTAIWARMHPSELHCTLMIYAAPWWATLHPKIQCVWRLANIRNIVPLMQNCSCRWSSRPPSSWRRRERWGRSWRPWGPP